MTENILKVGVIGLGVGFKHLQAYEAHPRCKVVSICDFLDDKLAEAGKGYPPAFLTKDAEKVIEDPEIDLISIASFDNYHYDQTVHALKSGKHVFIEKPLCLHHDEAIEIRKLLTRNPSLKLSSNLNLRTYLLFKNLKKRIGSGSLGEIFYFEGDYLWGRVHKLTDGWRAEMPFYSIVYGAAVHMIDLLVWLVDDRPIEVQGYGNNIATRGSRFRFHDFVSLLLRFDSGMVAKISASGGCIYPHFHAVTVYGTAQTFVNDLKGARLIRNCDPRSKPEEIPEGYSGEQKHGVIDSFIDDILDGSAQAMVSTEDVFATMSICLAAEEAVKTGRAVKIEYI